MDLPYMRRAPRPSLAMCDPLSALDVSSLPPLPASPTDDHVSFLGVPPQQDLGIAAPEREETSGNTGSGKLVDIVTPMPIHRTLQPKPAADSRMHVAPSIVEECPPTIRKIRKVEERENADALDGAEQDLSSGAESKHQTQATSTLRLHSTFQGDRHSSAIEDFTQTANSLHTPRPVRRLQSQADDSLLVPTFSSPRKRPEKTTSNAPPQTSLADTSRFPGLTTSVIGDLDDISTTDLMGEDASFMHAMMQRSPSDSTDFEKTTSGPVVAHERIAPHAPMDEEIGLRREVSPVKWKGKGRAMDDVREEREPPVGSSSPDVPRRENMGSVLAGMAAYEASLGRQVGDHLVREGEKVQRIQVVVSKASSSPSVSTMRPSVDVTSGSPGAARVPSSTLLSVSDQTGDTSTLFPSSPSIKRYMSTQRQDPATRASALPLDLQDDSRLDMVDLSDLRSVKMIADDGDSDETLPLFLDTSRSHAVDADRSTLYPSSPAVRRNMDRSTMDLMRVDELPDLDSRLDQSVCQKHSRPHGEPERLRVDTMPPMGSSSSSAVSDSPAKRHRRARRDSDGLGNQTMDLGAMIKRTSRKLTTDCGDMTFLAPTPGTGRGRGGALDMSMLMDIQSPFKSVAQPGSDQASRKQKERDVEESYYDLLGGDNTFMKQVEDVTIGDDSPIKGNMLPPALQTRRPTVTERDEFVFKVPELPRMARPREPTETSSTNVQQSPTRPRVALPQNSRNISPVRSTATVRTLSTPARSVQTAGTTRTMFTPSSTRTPTVTSGITTHKRNLSSDYRPTTTLPPRTPLAERGYGPQSVKKMSTSSSSRVLAETNGRNVNIRGQTTTTGLAGMKRSATLNDFTPVKNGEGVGSEETPRRRFASGHARAPLDSASGVKPENNPFSNEHKRPSTISSPTRLPPAKEATLPGPTSRIRLPGQGLRQVSGQGNVEDPDARTRKQAMSPEKVLTGVARSRPSTATIQLPKHSSSPSRTRTGFRPVTSQQSAPPRAGGASSGHGGSSAPGPPRTSTARLPTSRPGSSSSMLTARSSGLPSRISTSTISRPPSKSAIPPSSSSAATRMSAPSATLAGKASNGLPRPVTARSRSTAPVPAGTARPGSTSSAAAKSRLVAPTASQPRPSVAPTVRVGSSMAAKSAGLATRKPDIEVARGRLDRGYGSQR